MADTKAAIREVRDQLFLDRADQKYLSNVTANLNFERPLFGFGNDSLWRAVVRRLSLDYRQIANLFYDLLTEMFGPQKTVANVLSVDGIVLDEIVTVPIQQSQHRHSIPITSRTLPQRGVLVIDEGLASEETIQYSFRDPRTGEIELLTPLTQAHTALDRNASGYLKSDVPSSVGSTTLPLTNTNDFPTSGFPHPILIAPGTPEEEVTLLTGNNPTTGVLTVGSLANYQYGMRETPITSQLVLITGSDSHVIRVQDSSKFPEEGWIRVQQDVVSGLPSEDVEFIDNDITTGTLTLAKKLSGSYTVPPTGSITVSVLESKTSVQLAQVQVKGVEWDIFQTEQGILKIYIPQELSQNRLQDVSFLHGLALLSTPPTSVLRSAVAIGDMTLAATIGGTDKFPRSGILIIDAGGGSEEKVCYTRVDGKSSTKLYADGGGTIAIGTTTLFVEDITPIVAFDEINIEKKIVLSRDQGSPNEEVVYYQSLDQDNNTITLQAPTAKTHLPGALVTPIDGDTFYLTTPAVNSHIIGESLSLYQAVYAGTGSQAVGSLVVPAGSAIVDGDFFVVPDGINPPYTFEFDSDATLNYVGRIPITFVGTETAAQIRDLIITAINGTTIDITASIGGAAIVALLHDYKGTVGNQPILEYVSSPVFVASGMADGTDPLWDGRIFSLIDDLFQGHYLYDPGSPAIETTQTTLESNVAGPQKLEVTQHGTRTTLEISDATLFDATGNFNVTIRGGGSSETVDVQGTVLRRDAGPVTVTSNTSPGAYTVPLTGAALLPAPSAGPPYGYRIIFDRNGSNQEIGVVVSTAVSSCTLETPTTVTHLAGESVELMADVIELSQSLEFDHEGRIPWSQKLLAVPGPLAEDSKVSLVNEERRWIEVGSLFGVGDSFSKAGTTITFTDASAAFVTSDVGKTIRIAGAITSGNNGLFVITSRISGTQITYENAAGATEAFTGTWIIAGFPTTGSRVVINFGNARLLVESTLQTNHAAGGSSLVLVSTAKFPTSGYPYFVEIDVDASSIVGFPTRANVKETIAVSLNDPSTGTLTLVSPLKESHLQGSRVQYNPGPALAVTYSSTLTGPTRLVFRTSVRFEKSHVKGETVNLSGIQSLPSTKGSDYGFYLPSTWADRLQYLFDRGRAAGVQVVVINEK